MLNLVAIRRRLFLLLFRWRIQARHSPFAIFWACISLSVLIGIPVWIRFGTDVALPVLADATPILLAVVGVVMSYIQPKRESHKATTIILIIAGLLGTGILSANRIKGERVHDREMNGLNSKVDYVSKQNADLSNFLLSAKNSAKMTEADRRKGIETVLRNDYILSHNPVDPEILAGNRMPPNEWMNSRLEEMGESWSVSDDARSAPSSAPRSYLVYDGSPLFAGHSEGPPTEGNNFQPGDPVGFNIHFKVTGPNPIEYYGMFPALYIESNHDSATQREMLAKFIAARDTAFKGSKHTSSTLMPEYRGFISVVAWNSDNHFLIATQEELDKWKAGTEVVFVISEMLYKDGKIAHHTRRCLWLQRPAAAPGIWHSCEVFGESD